MIRHSGTLKHVDTAVVPIAGIGTRMAPYTSGSPKFMAPIMAGNEAVPNINYTLDDIIDAGIRNIVFITSSGGDEVLKGYIGPMNKDIAERYRSVGKLKDLAKEEARRAQFAGMNIAYIDQPAGRYGTAVALELARPALQGVEHFAFTGGDDFVWHPTGEVSELRRQLMSWQTSDADMSIMGKTVPRDQASNYGILRRDENSLELIVEKPAVTALPEDEDPLANITRYILGQGIWAHVDALLAQPRTQTQPEFYITDAINSAVQAGVLFHIHEVQGQYFDAGSPAGVRYASDIITAQLASRTQ